jgi:hypothetical protein
MSHFLIDSDSKRHGWEKLIKDKLVKIYTSSNRLNDTDTLYVHSTDLQNKINGKLKGQIVNNIVSLSSAITSPLNCQVILFSGDFGALRELEEETSMFKKYILDNNIVTINNLDDKFYLLPYSVNRNAYEIFRSYIGANNSNNSLLAKDYLTDLREQHIVALKLLLQAFAIYSGDTGYEFMKAREYWQPVLLDGKFSIPVKEWLAQEGLGILRLHNFNSEFTDEIAQIIMKWHNEKKI